MSKDMLVNLDVMVVLFVYTKLCLLCFQFL